MAISRAKALAYAEKVIARPRGEVPVTLRQSKGGVTLLYRGRALTRCHITRSGMKAAVFTAMALGVQLPPLGGIAQARVSTGVLWRAVSISCLDFRKRESYVVLERLLEEAEMQRGFSSTDA